MDISADGLSVQYVGERLGGNRAVRCEPPLPTQPFDALRTTTVATASSSRSPPRAVALSDVACHQDEDADGEVGADAAGARASWRLQLSPHCHVAYFEVSIDAPPSPSAAASGPGGVDCIAVGVGSAHFPLSGAQPGWDAHSYGYHSDDGRLFHGSGTRSAAFGPNYGPGDTVGCGVCLKTRQIFYTLNGRFLGVAFVAKQAQLPLYPLVGLDSHARVRFNFGQAPYRYELGGLPPSVGAKASAKAAAGCELLAPPPSPLRQLALAFTRSA